MFEALSERNILRGMAPHLVQALEILFPIYQQGSSSFLKVHFGMWLYDLLALFRNVKLHKTYRSKSLLQIEPSLTPERLQGGFLFYDSFSQDARLTLQIAVSAQEAGATLSNYVKLLHFKKKGNQLCAAQVQDVLTHETFSIQAHHFVNATGPWSNTVQQLADTTNRKMVRPTKGIHLIFSKEKLPIHHALLLEATDHRVFFIIPWGDHCLLGTTDTDYTGNLDEVYATQDDVHYLLQSLNRYFPKHQITPSDITSTYAGLRPLITEPQEASYHVSREHGIIHHPCGLISIVGGKLTTYRKMAQDVMDTISNKPCRTAQTPFSPIIRSTIAYETFSREDLRYLLDHEMTLTLNDVMMRRTDFFLKSLDQGKSKVPDIAHEMSLVFHWSSERLAQEISAYQYQIELSQKWRNHLI